MKEMGYVMPPCYKLMIAHLILCRSISFSFLFFRDYFLSTLVKLGSPEFRRSLVGFLPFKKVHRLRNVIDLMYNTWVVLLESKRRALREGDEAVARQIGRGRDIISILSTYYYFLLLYMLTDKFFLSESEYGSVRGRQIDREGGSGTGDLDTSRTCLYDC
jgi:hypothetical protein